jgi:hypothetical protein
MVRGLLAASCWFGLLAAGAAPAQQLGTIRFDHWLYFQSNTDGSERWQYRPRVYIPFGLSGGWTFTQRVDLPVYYTDKVGPDNPTGEWKTGIGDWFIEEAFASPELAKDLKLTTSVRFVFPTGGSSPFGSNQYQWAPAVGASYAIPERQVTLNPRARYFMSYHADQPGAAKIRRLDLYPTIRLGLSEGWSLAFYAQNPVSYNEVTHKWFVPISATLIRRLTKTVELSFGGAYGLIKDDPRYQYLVRSRLTFYF